MKSQSQPLQGSGGSDASLLSDPPRLPSDVTHVVDTRSIFALYVHPTSQKCERCAK